jgi:hypothetical protein
MFNPHRMCSLGLAASSFESYGTNRSAGVSKRRDPPSPSGPNERPSGGADPGYIKQLGARETTRTCRHGCRHCRPKVCLRRQHRYGGRRENTGTEPRRRPVCNGKSDTGGGGTKVLKPGTVSTVALCTTVVRQPPTTAMSTIRNSWHNSLCNGYAVPRRAEFASARCVRIHFPKA